MKSIYISLILFVSISFLINAQEVITTLSGHTAGQGFSILDDLSNTLVRVTGEGKVGIGTSSPTGLFDIVGNAGIGRGINILAENYFGNNGGSILLKGGYTDNGDPAEINIGGGKAGSNGGDLELYAGDSGPSDGGNIIIQSGHASTSGAGGDIQITSGTGQVYSGNIDIHTANSNMFGGNITIKTNQQNTGGGKIEISTFGGTSPGSDIDIKTGNSNSAPNNLYLSTGNGDTGGDIVLTTGDGGFGRGGNIVFTPGSGSPDVDGLVVVNGSGTYSGTWTQASDERFKENIEPLKNTLNKIEQLNGVSYEFRTEVFPDKNFSNCKQIGLIAQDVEKVFPELVETDSEGYKSIAYQNMVAVLIEAVKEQQQSIEELSKQIKMLEERSKSKEEDISLLDR